MTGEMIGNLLRPLIGKSGTIFMVVSRSGQIGFATGPDRKLTGVEIREDGLVRLVRDTGWAVLDPAEIVAVVWNDDTDLARPVPVSADPEHRRRSWPTMTSLVARSCVRLDLDLAYRERNLFPVEVVAGG